MKAFVAAALAVFGVGALIVFLHGCTAAQQEKVESAIEAAERLCTAMGYTDAQCIEEVIHGIQGAHVRAVQRTLDAHGYAGDASVPAAK